jgi:hypothetical protein
LYGVDADIDADADADRDLADGDIDGDCFMDMAAFVTLLKNRGIMNKYK